MTYRVKMWYRGRQRPPYLGPVGTETRPDYLAALRALADPAPAAPATAAPEHRPARLLPGEMDIPPNYGPPDDLDYLIQIAGAKARKDCKSVDELVAEGWEVAARDGRYGSYWMKKSNGPKETP